MKLIVQPDDGMAPVVGAVKKAKKTLDTTIFRFDRGEIEKALKAAAARGVAVRALIAHTNGGAKKSLRKLELRLLAAGVVVARTADDLARYHDKLMIVDGRILYVLGFNFTGLDMTKSRSFGIVTRKRGLVQEASKLFEADVARQPYTPRLDGFVVSPENARARLSAFIKGARRQLLIYDPKVTDSSMIRLLQERANAGVEIKLIGKLGKRGSGPEVQKLNGMRLHVRAMVQDGRRVFVGSQSLRKAELESRREVGVIVNDPQIAKRLQSTFERDWAGTAQEKDES